MSPAARLVVVGPGRVGRSLAAGLEAAGEEVEIRGRPAGAEEASPPRPERPEDDPSTVIFAVPDDALAAAVGAWAEGAGPGPCGTSAGADPSAPGHGGPTSSGPGPVALHTSGVHGPDVLDPLARAGFAAGTFHPLTSLAAPSADALRGVTFGVSGEAAAVERARALAGRLEGKVLELDPGEHARYHAAAVFASNFLAACLAVAGEELAAATGGRGGADDLAPLARAALGNALERGLPDGLTGPVERGDVETVRRHLATLSAGRRRLYRDLARELLAVVQDRLPAGRSRDLRELLDPGGT